MVTVAASDVGEVYQSNTAPLLEFAFLQANGASARDITGYAAWCTFWTAGAAAPHVIRAARISDPTNGLVRYELQGDEYATLGECLFQCTIMQTALNTGDDNGYFERSTQAIRRRVIAKAD
jgi:hypothetical protein